MRWRTAEDMLARRRAGLDLIRVELRGRADPHRLHIWVIDDLQGVAGELGQLVLLGGGLRLLDGGVGDDHRVGRLARRQGLEVHKADAPSTDDTDVEHAIRQTHVDRAAGCGGAVAKPGELQRVGDGQHRGNAG